MSYIRKTKDEYQLLCNYGYGDGWEYVLAEDTMKEARAPSIILILDIVV